MRATAWWLICQLAAATIAGDREQFKYGVDDEEAELLVVSRGSLNSLECGLIVSRISAGSDLQVRLQG